MLEFGSERRIIHPCPHELSEQRFGVAAIGQQFAF
jgi:hypothetical protein